MSDEKRVIRWEFEPGEADELEFEEGELHVGSTFVNVEDDDRVLRIPISRVLEIDLPNVYDLDDEESDSRDRPRVF